MKRVFVTGNKVVNYGKNRETEERDEEVKPLLPSFVQNAKMEDDLESKNKTEALREEFNKAGALPPTEIFI